MLADISWGAYMTAVIVLLGLWYGYVLMRFYPNSLKNKFKRKARSQIGFTEKRMQNGTGAFAEFSESFSTLEDAEELYSKIIKLFTESDSRGLSKTELLNYLSFVFEEYPFVKQSALREKINSLTAEQSISYPDLMLSVEEADSLWESEQ